MALPGVEPFQPSHHVAMREVGDEADEGGQHGSADVGVHHVDGGLAEELQVVDPLLRDPLQRDDERRGREPADDPEDDLVEDPPGRAPADARESPGRVDVRGERTQRVRQEDHPVAGRRDGRRVPGSGLGSGCVRRRAPATGRPSSCVSLIASPLVTAPRGADPDYPADGETATAGAEGPGTLPDAGPSRSCW
ncbi:hypothetical protein VV38_02610 [Clavibacter nebraskensis]|uniref:Uncharacterized protein n=1 Tax=Clavibacter nebraskensis TaxID=31963 RepID=A0A399QEW3_9MICO|nr:hypothetical protein VV38_02610 [Clavibacter nebraskensis]OAH18335.1 hypothetical protein A3Q38_11880 [Clavibacter nebraskensis]RIJ17310.1 hypothetical protein DZF97_03125 [Clavibacter nebraskensis]